MTAVQARQIKDRLLNDYNPAVKSYSIDGETITVNSVKEFLEYIAFLDSVIRASSGRPPFGVLSIRGNSAR